MSSNLFSLGTTASGTSTCLSGLISISAATYVYSPFLSPFSSCRADKVFSPIGLLGGLLMSTTKHGCFSSMISSPFKCGNKATLAL